MTDEHHTRCNMPGCPLGIACHPMIDAWILETRGWRQRHGGWVCPSCVIKILGKPAKPDSDIAADPIVETLIAKLRTRSTVGVRKYGTTLAANNLPLKAWLEHHLEELLDAAGYVQRAIAAIDETD